MGEMGNGGDVKGGGEDDCWFFSTTVLGSDKSLSISGNGFVGGGNGFWTAGPKQIFFIFYK